MARDEMARDERKRTLLDRRDYLKATGASVAAFAGLGAAGAAAQDGSEYLLFESFDSTEYRDVFTDSWRLGHVDEPTTATARSGDQSLHVPLDAGEHYGMDATLDLADAGITDDPPRELYASYWVRFGDGFDMGGDTFACKLPGFQNHERRESGTAGDPSDGTNGWAARGMFTSANDGVGLGYYCYHMDQRGNYGDMFDATSIADGEWHHIEQYVRLNTTSGSSANRDGALTMWVDGNREYHRDGMAFTLSPERGVNYAFRVYYGGSDPSPADNDVYIDDWILSTERVGHPGTGDGSGSDGGSDDGSESEDGTVFLLEGDSGADGAEYEFVVDGSVSGRESPADEAIESYNDEIVDNGDGTYTVTGVSSEGYADSYYVDGAVTNITLDASLWTLYWGGKEVTVDELTGNDGESGDGSESGSVDVTRFDISKSESLGNNRMFSVQWAVSSPNEELDTVEVVAAQGTSDLNFAVTDVGGESASGWDLFQFPVGTELEVSLRVTTAAENVTKETKSVTL